MAAEDQNYFVCGHDQSDEPDRTVATGFFYPSREILIQYFWEGEFTTRRNMEIYNISVAEQRHLWELEWTVSKPISVVDRMARVTEPEHLTIFDEARKVEARKALSDREASSPTSDSEPQSEQT